MHIYIMCVQVHEGVSVCARKHACVCVHVYIIVTYNVYVSGTQVTSDSLGDLGPRILRGTYYECDRMVRCGVKISTSGWQNH